jgi:hypothetical protein
MARRPSICRRTRVRPCMARRAPAFNDARAATTAGPQQKSRCPVLRAGLHECSAAGSDRGGSSRFSARSHDCRAPPSIRGPHARPPLQAADRPPVDLNPRALRLSAAAPELSFRQRGCRANPVWGEAHGCASGLCERSSQAVQPRACDRAGRRWLCAATARTTRGS